MIFHSFPKITMVATPNLFLNPFYFFGSPSRRDSGCDNDYQDFPNRWSY